MSHFKSFKYLLIIPLLLLGGGLYVGDAAAMIQQQAGPTKKIKAFSPPNLDYAKICISQAPLNVVVGAKTSHLSTPKRLHVALKLLNGGVGVFPDPVRAIRLLREVAETKTPHAARAKMQLARLYIGGIFLPENQEIARALVKEVAPGDPYQAAFFMGHIHQKLSEYGKAEEYYKRSALAGNPMAYLTLAYMYRDGLIAGIDQAQIDQFITLAENRALEEIAQGNCKVAHDFGKIFLRHNLSSDDYPAGIKWLEASAASNNYSAISYLGLLYLYGIQVKQDIDKGIAYYELGAKHNDAESLYRLGIYWLVSQGDLLENRHKGAAYLASASQQGHQGAIKKLAHYYRGDYKDTPQPEKAVQLMERAITIPDIAAEIPYMLAEDYEMGKGIAKNEKRAFALYDRAAKLNSLDALVKLGHAYKYGIGVKRTPMKSYRFYRQAASAGSREAMVHLVENYECGVGRMPSQRYQTFWKHRAIHEGAGKLLRPEVKRLMLSKKKQDNIDGFMLLKRRVSGSDREAMVMLSHFYNNGIGTAQDRELADKWLQEAVREGEGEANGYVALGEAYLEEGEMFESQPLKARQYFERAMMLGNDNAGYELGKLLSEGSKDFPADKEAAIVAFYDAVNQNNDNAMRKLAGLFIEQGKEAKAVQLLERSIALYNIDSIMELVSYYLTKPKTDVQAFKKANYWYEKVVDYYPCSPRERAKIERLTAKINSHNSGNVLTSPAEIQRQAEQGNVRAMRKMAQRFIYGAAGVEPSPKEAFRWYVKAAQAGDSVSMMEIGNAFSTGLGIAPSQVKARQWWERAAKAGSAKAKQMLAVDASVVHDAPVKKPGH
ncbi:MAG: tetratricopeptide repeat protein [Rickettsiales bacterium]|nr:tetratricopeptide repeat protein [Rickettsiales bacterium]